MNIPGMLSTVLGCLMLIGGAAADEKEPASKKESPVRVECHGKLRHGVVAIGGETTGTTIEFEGITWDLNLPDDASKTFAKDNHKKPVTAVGTLRQVKGPERGVRWIIDVEKLTLPTEAAQKDGAQMTIAGTLQKKPAATGEPARPVIEVDEMSWPLDFGEDQSLEQKADSLIGKPVLLVGSPGKDKDAKPEKLWLRVQKIDAAAPKIAAKH